MKVNIHLHLTEKERAYLETKLGKDYIDILIKECIDISKMKLCIYCNKWFSRTSIKRHNSIFHNNTVYKAILER